MFYSVVIIVVVSIYILKLIWLVMVFLCMISFFFMKELCDGQDLCYSVITNRPADVTIGLFGEGKKTSLIITSL